MTNNLMANFLVVTKDKGLIKIVKFLEMWLFYLQTYKSKYCNQMFKLYNKRFKNQNKNQNIIVDYFTLFSFMCLIF
jgi:uncharacterized membrane protein YwaF